MFSMKPRTALPISITCAALSTLAACGGSDGNPGAVVTNPQPPAQPPAPPPAQPAPTQPTPPSDPAPTPPPTSLTLEPDYTAISTAPGISQPNWPAWRHSGTDAVDGVGCAATETYHVHALLTVYRNGVRLGLPDSIGRGSGCNYEMHTHDASGVIHIEADTPKTFTLGQFLSLWGQDAGTASALGLPGPIRYYVVQDERITPVATDPATIVLDGYKEIVIISGTPPATLPRYDWRGSGL
jgi:hypothetical protein